MDLMSERIDSLTSMLEDCRKGKVIMIGDGKAYGNFGMIQFMPTAGGQQYGIREVSMRGTGSGRYFPIGHEDDLIIAAIQLIEHAERPHPLTQKMIKEGRITKPEPLGFHFLQD